MGEVEGNGVAEVDFSGFSLEAKIWAIKGIINGEIVEFPDAYVYIELEPYSI